MARGPEPPPEYAASYNVVEEGRREGEKKGSETQGDEKLSKEHRKRYQWDAGLPSSNIKERKVDK
jgi:hypothetical protein